MWLARWSENPIVYLFSILWRYSAGHRGALMGYVALFIIATSISLFAQPVLWAHVMNTIQERGVQAGSLHTLLLLLGLTVVADIVFWMFHGPARVIERANAFRARASYRRTLLRGVMGLPIEWHAEHHSGDTIDRMEKGTTALMNFAEGSFDVLYAILEMVGSFIVLAYFSWTAGAIVTLAMLATAVAIIRFDRRLIPQYRDLNLAENRVSESIFDAISNITTVVILRVETLVFRAIARKIDAPYALHRHNAVLNEVKWFLTTLWCSLMVAAVLGAYFWQQVHAGHAVLVGTAYLLMKYLNKISETFFRFTGLYSNLVRQKTRVQNAEELTTAFRDIPDQRHTLPADWRALTIEGLTFTYPGSASGGAQLKDVSLTVRRGERIALVGASGSGKTTFLKVLRDLYHPDALTLSVDGQPLPEGFPGIAEAIALVPQNPEIFATTIRENITVGAEHTDEEIRRFTDLACFTDVVTQLPNGLDSSIKERGVNLSGGQQQRLALSRGLMACEDKDIILLDEPTSSLDAANELRIYRNIFRETEGKTVISSIHRLHLLPRFDRVVVFDAGRIIGDGSLEDVLSTCSTLQQLWREYHRQQQDVTEDVDGNAHTADAVEAA